MIVSPFPSPPVAVQQALSILDLVAGADAAVIAELGEPGDLPRPWLPATCPPDLRHHLWLWCEQVVTWINHDYTWRPAGMIPSCWPQHPHLAHELPGLACQRALAEQADTPGPLEEWHRYTLTTFLDRMTSRLGESTCRTGRHIDWPAAARYDAHTSDATRAEHQATFSADTGHRTERGYRVGAAGTT